jgi:two-component system, OmpR family, phosphate regulon response regulator OmpR
MSLSGKQILLVDDDPKLRDLVRRYLTDNQFEVAVAQDAVAMNRLIQREAYDLIILDQMLPGEDGLSILRRLRGAGDKTPILMLTAKGDDVDRIIGLEMGADDYLPKPFNPRELLARLNAILRRAPVNQPGAPSLDGQNVIVKFGNLTLDLNTRTLVKTVDETSENIALTTGEFSVLKILAQHARQPISRDKLMVLARGREYGAFDRSLDVQISRLRKLIETDAQSPRYLQTVWGVGYVLIPD